MRIVIFGANGKVGSLLVAQALAEGHQVIAYIRKSGSVLNEHPNLKVIVGNLNEALKMADAIAGADACISTIGSKSLIRRTPQIVAGMDNIVSIMKQEGVHRFIYLSSIGAGESRFMIAWPIRLLVVNLVLRAPLADHNANEQRIASSNLLWTVVRPCGYTDGPLTKNIQHGIIKFTLRTNSVISRANVAYFMLKQLSDETYINKCVWLYEK